MGKTLATVDQTDALNPPSRGFSEDWLRSLRRGLGSENGRPILMAGFRINPGQAKLVQHNRLTLARRLTGEPDERPLIAAEIARLVSAFPSQDAGAALGGALNAEAYVEALGDMPAWAVRLAREDIFAGRTKFGRPFGPTPVEFGDMVRAILAPYRNDLNDLLAIETAVREREPSTDERQRVAAGFDKLRGDVAASLEAERAPKKPTRDQDAAALRGRLLAKGMDAASLDAIPDQPTTFRQAGR